MGQSESRVPRKPTCPQGHTENLQLRIVVDTKPVLVENGKDGAYLQADEDRSKWDDNPENSGSMVGTNGGVWCQDCEEWYDESQCIPEK